MQKAFSFLYTSQERLLKGKGLNFLYELQFASLLSIPFTLQISKQGVSTLRRAVLEVKPPFWESEDFAANRETWEIFRKTQSNEVKISGNFRFFRDVSPKNLGRYFRFWEDFYLHMVLFKQHLLERHPPFSKTVSVH